MITKRRVGWSVASVAATTLALVGIAEAQDVGGLVGEAWRVGGPIAAVVTVMLLASGIAIRALWNQLRAVQKELKDALTTGKTDTVTLARELRDCANASSAALNSHTTAVNRLAERVEEAARNDRRTR